MSATDSLARPALAGRADIEAGPQLRQDVLDQGRRIVRGARLADYGGPEANLAAIAEVWNSTVLREVPIALTARDVALMMVGLKLVRATGRVAEDDLVDAAGYLLLASEADPCE